jgi:hypothetical protein
MALRALVPECSGLVMVPKLAASPPDSDAAMPSTSAMRSRGTFMSRAHAMAAPIVPMLDTACQPTVVCAGAARASFTQTS